MMILSSKMDIFLHKMCFFYDSVLFGRIFVTFLMCTLIFKNKKFPDFVSTKLLCKQHTESDHKSVGSVTKPASTLCALQLCIVSLLHAVNQ